MTEPHPLDAGFPVGFAIYAMSRAQRALAASRLAGLGLFPGQEILLMQLDEADGRSQKELAASMRVSQATVAKMTARMERAGLVRRAGSARDRRISLVHLTPAGRDLRSRVLQAWERLNAVADGVLDDTERAAFLATTSKIRRALDAAAAREPAP